MQNDVCPITLEPLADKATAEVYAHADVGFDMLALYEYLLTAPSFVNPVNRLPLAVEDLQRLERQMETLFGEGCILREADRDDEVDAAADDDDDDDNDGDERTDGMGVDEEGVWARASTFAFGSLTTTTTATTMTTTTTTQPPSSPRGAADDDEDDDEHEHELAATDGGVDWLDDAELISRLTTSITHDGSEASTRLIRLQVDIDVGDAVQELQASPPPRSPVPFVPLPCVEEEKEDEDNDDDPDVGQDVDHDLLPPRRTFLSVVDMYHDSGRQRRISDQLAMLQFLEHDAMSILVHILDIHNDAHFHRFVWQHTSLDVMDTVTTYLTGGMPATTSSPGGSDNEGDDDEERGEREHHHQGLVDGEGHGDGDGDEDGEGGGGSQMFTHIIEPRSHPLDPADYELEVVYTDCWEIYRTVILHNLERRYVETARDVRTMGLHDFQALLACHRALVHQRAAENATSYDSVLQFLHNVERDFV